MKIDYLLLIAAYSFFLKQITSTRIAKCSKEDVGKYLLETKNGQVKGSCSYVNINDDTNGNTQASNVYFWLGIPYAQAPVGTNRFKAPKSIANWSPKILDGTKWPNSCLTSSNVTSLKQDEQFNGFTMWLTQPKYTKQSEDCLYLNVWIPDYVYLKLDSNLNLLPANGTREKVPIMIFIHGSSGTSALDIYNPSTFVAFNKIIVITISYRQGIFGNFYMSESEFTGNQGLLDQHEAFKWIYDNADLLGGDRNRITLVGSSMGAMYIGYHLVYEKSWPLFNNVILQAGSPFTPSIASITTLEANSIAREFLRYFNCTNDDEQVECALSLLADDYSNRVTSEYFTSEYLNNNYLSNAFLNGFFKPVIDGNVIKEPLIDSYTNGRIKNCSILTGFASDEGSMFIAYSGLIGTKIKDLTKRPSIDHDFINDFLGDFYEFYPNYPLESSQSLLKSILYEYTKVLNRNESSFPPLKNDFFNELSKLIGDSIFVCPAIRFANTYSKINKNVFVYVNSHRLTTTPWPNWYGVAHGDELALIFGQPLTLNKTNQAAISVNPWSRYSLYKLSERQLSRNLMTYWGNFIKFNDPNDAADILDGQLLKWLPFKSNNNQSERNYFMIHANGKNIKNYAADKCTFWNELVPVFVQEKIELENLTRQALRISTSQESSTKSTTIHGKSNRDSSHYENQNDKEAIANNYKILSFNACTILLGFLSNFCILIH